MRCPIVVVVIAASVIAPSRAGAAQPNHAFSPATTASDCNHGGAVRRLAGHTFVYPATFDSALVTTSFATRTAARFEAVNDVPFGTGTRTIQSFGVSESVDFEARFDERWGIRLGVVAQATTGTDAVSLAARGGVYAYGATAGAAWRVVRIESSGTQVTARLDAFGLEGGARLTLVPLVRSVRSQALRSIPEIVSSVGEYLVVPASSLGGGSSLNIAQALSPMFSVQASFRLDVRRFRQSPYIEGQNRIDLASTAWIPQGGIAVGFDPLVVPISWLAEYRLSAQADGNPIAPAEHVVAVGGRYSGRSDLELGLTAFGEFHLPAVEGLDGDGVPVVHKRGNAVSGQLAVRYFW